MERIVERLGLKARSDDEKLKIHVRKHHDVFFIWLVLMFIAVIGAHFVLNVTQGIPTGYVTAQENPVENMTLLLQAMLVLFVTILIVGITHEVITHKDR